MNNKMLSACSFALACTLASHTALAAVSPDQANQLGSGLTPIGAEMDGNADGSIPAWTGGLPKDAGTLSAQGFLSNPFANEQPLFTITAQNAAQYQDKLSPGQQAMLKRYATYQIPVYPSHRSASLPDAVYQAAKENATRARLVEGGNGLVDFSTAIPFPIPQNGLEVLWNHITRYRGGSAKRTHVQATPLASGKFMPVYFKQQFTFRDRIKDFNPAKPGNVLFYYRQLVTAPARQAGDVVLVHETLNQVKEPRMAWIYNAGQRRVRRAPQISYDGPYPASEGQRVADNLDMYNGAPDRYDWKLVGKREIYIPYNSFKLDSPTLKYSDIVHPGHLNPAHTRYELHRVWEVEGTLKKGERHIYARRVFFIDEDSWQIALADHYDSRGTLWRTAEGHLTPLYDVQVPWLGAEALYDLINGRYIVSGMRNEEKDPVEFGFSSLAAEYTPAALRNAGIR
ncbi:MULTISPECIES: DUF1329 domain-containing protein [unclassified Pseudomonas]|uniref:DUF1329 domain-containing protein n=1 Tax=unclassified Pseudomonas TaxID=196821 RepID=UPI00244792F1|nr:MULTISPECIES: DUF1329 domain-containing protein [unclassified Pseudomonas]MDG9930581.1 DUF1329 domain-containing protein [Pseudomonas sp. GD04042]MDH0485078.1 DUF1329 domain-containing protein [Pseudomonas sp. GD04015]MDH0605742.1 DUF1329 domain-containing protein [Pseudomonas sp. GD03869]